MLFNSFEFMFFFPVVTLLYFLLPQRYRWTLLLGASCFFYMYFVPVYILILAVTIVVDYGAGIWIEQAQGNRRKQYMVISVVVTCLILFIFKYFNFFNANLAHLAEVTGWNYPIEALNLILPIGLSFHTFQSLSYVIEVYRGHQKAERHFGIYALYVMFFPQLVAGPIERPQNLLPQFREEHRFEYKRVTDGLKLMAWGLFKKMVIADRIAAAVNTVYGAPTEFEGLALIIATVLFAVQIYCDFSGYSDVAIGVAQVMGFRLMKNFDRPYYSKSIAEFWKRWHISLSTWFKDYLYISMGGNQVPRWRWQYNLAVTFVVSGLWHGANWTFIVWGGLNAFYLLFAIWTKEARQKAAEVLGLTRVPRFRKALQILTTFSLICFAWIFFRAGNLADALYVASHLFDGIGSILKPGYVMGVIGTLGLSITDFQIAMGAIAVMEAVHLIQRQGQIRDMLVKRPSWQRWTLYYAVVFVILFAGRYGNQDFIYFQF